MPTLDSQRSFSDGVDRRPVSGEAWWNFWPVWLALALVGAGCKKDAAMEAIESDANGYVCLKCGAKLYTARSVFLGSNCPKCKEQSLIDVVGYLCEKDRHLTIRASRGDPIGAVCEQCQARVNNAMYMPKEKDLKAWGATKPAP